MKKKKWKKNNLILMVCWNSSKKKISNIKKRNNKNKKVIYKLYIIKKINIYLTIYFIYLELDSGFEDEEDFEDVDS